MLENTGAILPVYITTFIFGLPANVVALYAFIKKVRQGATPVDVLLIGLTISDLLFLIFLPLWIKEAVDDMRWEMPHFLCPLSKLVFYGSLYNSSLFLTAISVERYLAVAYPITYKLNRKSWHAVVGSVVIWTISMAECSIVYVMQYYHHLDDDSSSSSSNNTLKGEAQANRTCFKDFSSEQLNVLLPFRLQLCVVLFCVPLLICCFCYINFIRILSRLPNICPRRRRRAIGLALGTLVIFVICFGPHNVSHLVGYTTGESPGWRKHAVLTSTFNACLDPFIYYFSSSALRATFRGIFGCCLPLQSCCCGRVSWCTAEQPAAQPPVDTRTQSTNDKLD
ncbi:free fatty acid receptor 3-like [Engraulis encrasicolus]|uniref:free fatty acid receptor 3-like n=1 Tax=Engraulis encrasicolus TaxID=184585 RepID=UPI002FD5926A